MDIINSLNFYSFNTGLSNWLWSHKQMIVTSWIAVLLVLYGDELNKLLKRIMRPYHYLLRMLSFVVLCTVGYGFIAIYSEIGVNQLLSFVHRHWFAGIVIFIYLLLGFLAERKHQA
ncbi:MAG: DUF3392 family protein [Gammaproteobacteria bacterium]|nr:DUF3392 family protein [Gammaproteobacteria bacterium]